MLSASPLTLVTSDLHLAEERDPAIGIDRTVTVFNAMIDLGIDLEISSLVLAGDVVHKGAKHKTLLEDSARMRSVAERAAGHFPILWIRGNHDIGMNRKKVRALLGEEVTLVEPLTLTQDGVFIHHGHLKADSLVQSLMKAIRAFSTSPDHWNRQRFAKHSAEKIIRECEGWKDLDPLLRENMRSMRQMYQQTFLRMDCKALKKNGGNGYCTTAQLGAIAGAWASIDGHDHKQRLEAVPIWDPQTDGSRLMLGGNCGSFKSAEHGPTCILASYPELSMWEYDSYAEAMVQSADMRLPIAPTRQSEP